MGQFTLVATPQQRPRRDRVSLEISPLPASLLFITDLPLFLAAGGLAGLGGYVYLQRNPQVVDKVESKAKDLQGEVKASNESPAAAGALIKCV